MSADNQDSANIERSGDDTGAGHPGIASRSNEQSMGRTSGGRPQPKPIQAIGDVPEFPDRDAVVPESLTCKQVCEQYPNSLFGTMLDPFIHYNWSSGQIFEALPQAAKDFMTNNHKDGGKSKSPANAIAKRLQKRRERHAKAGTYDKLMEASDIRAEGQHNMFEPSGRFQRRNTRPTVLSATAPNGSDTNDHQSARRTADRPEARRDQTPVPAMVAPALMGYNRLTSPAGFVDFSRYSQEGPHIYHLPAYDEAMRVPDDQAIISVPSFDRDFVAAIGRFRARSDAVTGAAISASNVHLVEQADYGLPPSLAWDESTPYGRYEWEDSDFMYELTEEYDDQAYFQGH